VSTNWGREVTVLKLGNRRNQSDAPQKFQGRRWISPEVPGIPNTRSPTLTREQLALPEEMRNRLRSRSAPPTAGIYFRAEAVLIRAKAQMVPTAKSRQVDTTLTCETKLI